MVGCRFASGLRVVYKPKSLRSEIVLSDLLRWLNDRGLSTPLRPLTVLDRGDYGWVEHCAQAPAGDAGAVARHYRRAGALLALMRAVGGTDAHMENLVAAGEHPQIVDAETVLRPRLVDVEVAAAGAPSAFDEAARRIDESVLAVGLLPSWSVSEDGLQAIDVSGLGARGPQRSWRERRTWEAPNTDLARRVMELAPVPEAANEVVLDGVTQRCEEHAEAIEAGFVEAYGLLRAGRAELGGPAGPLAGLAGAPVRVIFRNTQLYALALGSAASSEHMRDGVDRSIALEALARPLLDRRDARGHWPLLRSELAELEAGDIPYFAVPGGDDWLAVDGGGVPLAESALEGARRRLAALDDQDLARQVSYVRAALEARGDGPEAARPVPRRGSAEPIDGARAIGRILDERAIRGDRGGLAWIGPSLVHASGRVQLRPSGFDLYGGVVGVAVFLAALARAGGDPRPARLAAAALAPVLEAVDGGADRIPPAIGLGGSAGAGGLVHGLVAVHRLSGDGAPLDAATAIARAVRDDAIDADERLDLMGGAAGLCLGFLALHRETGDQVVLAKARRAGERLLARQRPEPEGGAAWPTWSGAALCFPSHGASGMALALARLADRAEDPRFGDAAARAFDFEDACFDPGRGGWPDRRDSARTGPPSAQWCHGAAGVGLTRLGLRGTAVGAARAGADDVALAAAIAAAGRDFPERDNLCCGAAGVAEFVRAAGDPAAGSPVAAAASAWAGDVAARVIAGDPVRLFARAVGGLPAPGLYLGLAGIGMALLGRRDPELPGVLLWN